MVRGCFGDGNSFLEEEGGFFRSQYTGRSGFIFRGLYGVSAHTPLPLTPVQCSPDVRAGSGMVGSLFVLNGMAGVASGLRAGRPGAGFWLCPLTSFGIVERSCDFQEMK